MNYYTPQELNILKRLQRQLKKSKAHSVEAINIGQQIREIDAEAFRRHHSKPMPAWMREFAKRNNLL